MMASLQWRLSLALVLGILLAGLVGGVYAYRAAYHEAEELQDDTLRQIAVLVARQDQGAGTQPAVGRKVDNAEDPRLLISRYDGSANATLPLPAGLPSGLGTYEVSGLTYRVLIARDHQGHSFALAQRASFRDEIARDNARQSLFPLGFLIPALLLLVPTLVRHSFRPVDRAARDLAARGSQDMRPIDTQGLPSEVQPFAQAINALMLRLADNMEQQRRFIADAAHELRSPMAALSLQAERLAQCTLAPDARQRLETMVGGIARSQRLLEQLLDLARAQSGARPYVREPVSVADLFHEVVEAAMPLAIAKGIDLGVVGSPETTIVADRFDMVVALGNLVSNAIKYAPEGSSVDLGFEPLPKGWRICVTDQGQGMVEADIARMTQPFYRTQGSQGSGAGLGLAIVKAIADRGDFQLRFANLAGGGFRAELHADSQSG